MNRKPIFDAVRKLLGRRFTEAEVAALDRAIDAPTGALPANEAPDVRAPDFTETKAEARTLGAAGTALI